MNCKELKAHLPDYLDDEVLDEICKELEAHMNGCESCRIQVNTLRHTIELYKRMPSRCVPGHVEERLFKVLQIDRIEKPEE